MPIGDQFWHEVAAARTGPGASGLQLLLQAFDPVATYAGVHAGVPEANPIISRAFEYVGVGPALLLFKLKACGLLLLLSCLPRRRLVEAVFGALAVVHLAMSVVPWTVALLFLPHA